MLKRGRMKYVPKEFLCELEGVKLEKGLTKDADVFREITDYTRVGREVERLMTLKFLNNKRKN